MARYVYFAIIFIHVFYVYVHADLECHSPWRQQRVSYVYVSVHDNANACQCWHAYWRDVVMKNESPDMLSLVNDIIDTSRSENDERKYNLSSNMMALETTPKTTILWILIFRTNMLSPITFCRSTWHQPKQWLQLHFDKMQCPRYFFMGFTCHPTHNTMFTSFLYGVYASSHTKYNVHVIHLWGPSVTHANGEIPRESGPHGNANTSFAYMELTCPPCVRPWGP